MITTTIRSYRRLSLCTKNHTFEKKHTDLVQTDSQSTDEIFLPLVTLQRWILPKRMINKRS